MSTVSKLFQPHLLKLSPYSSARDEFEGEAPVMLDANESGEDWVGSLDFGLGLSNGVNRYPDPHQRSIKERLSELKGVRATQIFLGNGSDEPIDLILRLFCIPGKDKVMILPPTYGMYSVSAQINNLEVIKVPLTSDFTPEIEKIAEVVKAESDVKVLFLCSPNNPTGNAMSLKAVEAVLEVFPGIVVVDEAYVDFSTLPTAIPMIKTNPRVIVLQTFSKAWGMAGLRVGLAIADEEIVAALDKIKPPYNINLLSQKIVIKALGEIERQRKVVAEIIAERDVVSSSLRELSCVSKVYPSDSNFLLVRFVNSKLVFSKLIEAGIVVRDRAREVHCENCLRITIGTKQENEALLTVLSKI